MKQFIWTLKKELPNRWKKELSKEGITYFHFPLIHFEKIKISENEMLETINSTDGILLTSRIAAQFFCEYYKNPTFVKQKKIFTISAAAQERLSEEGISAEKIANHRTDLTDEKLLATFPNSRFELIHFCSEITPPCDWRNLIHLGINVKRVPIYRTLTRKTPELATTINNDNQTMIVFGSPSGVDGFLDHFKSLEVGLVFLSNHDIAAMGKSTENKLKNNGITKYVRSNVPDINELMKNILNSKFIMEELNEFTG